MSPNSTNPLRRAHASTLANATTGPDLAKRPSSEPSEVKSPRIPTDWNASLASHALQYAEAGFKVLPCRENSAQGRAKSPYTINGHKDASTDPEKIARWWSEHPHALIGLVPPKGYVVIDIDPRHGGSLDALSAFCGETSLETLTANSGRGEGCHLWFTSDQELTQRAGIIPGIDARVGNKGYLIAPPSLHPETGKPYTWAIDAPIKPLPARIEQSLSKNKATVSHGQLMETSGVHRQVSPLVRLVLKAPAGKRNDTLFWSACRMAERQWNRKSTNWTGLIAAAETVGLMEQEIKKTINSALKAVSSNSSLENSNSDETAHRYLSSNKSTSQE